jgi:hypothetical protein
MVSRLLKSCATTSKLTNRVHLLCLAQCLLGFPSRFVFRFQLPGALVHPFFQSLGEGAQLRDGAFAVCHVHIDANNAHSTAVGVVKVDIARFNPSQTAVAGPHNPEFRVRVARPLREGGVDQVIYTRDVLSKNALHPGLIEAIEFGHSVQ